MDRGAWLVLKGQDSNLGSDKKQICTFRLVDPELIHLRVRKSQGSVNETRTIIIFTMHRNADVNDSASLHKNKRIDFFKNVIK